MKHMEELETNLCPLCNSDKSTITFNGKDFLYSKKDFTVVSCSSCGVMYTNPRVKKNQIGNYYFKGYSPYKPVKRNPLLRTMIDLSGNIFGNINIEIHKDIKSYNFKTVLEVGPGSGSLLQFLKKNNYQVAGVEIDNDCVERIKAQGIECYCGELSDYKRMLGTRKFELIILCHVLEHLYNPREIIEIIYSLLSDNGILYMILPDVGSIEAKLFGKYWIGWDLPRHVVHYNRNTVRDLLTKSGFKVISIRKNISSSFFIESIGFRFLNGKMPNAVYKLLYYPWKILTPLHSNLFGTGVMKVIAKKGNLDGKNNSWK